MTETDKTAQERERFEAWLKASRPDASVEREESGAYSGEYIRWPIEMAWIAWQARAALDTGAVPTGWKLVPVEPTQEMITSGWIDKEDVSPAEIYGSMLAAAPQPPASEYPELDAACDDHDAQIGRDCMRAIESVMRDDPTYADWAPADMHEDLEKAREASASAGKVEPTHRFSVPPGQTPLNDKLDHPLLEAFRAGVASRDTGVGSPYHGHSLEHCLHAAGFVQRDLRLALDNAKLVPHPDARQAAEEMRDRCARACDDRAGDCRFAEDREAAECAAAIRALPLPGDQGEG